MLRRTLSPWLILLLALTVVLVIDPWAVLAVGFWFSFGAVAFLLYVSAGRVGGRPWWYTVLATQAAVTLSLAPLSLALFQQVSLVGPLANAVAIPLVTMLVGTAHLAVADRAAGCPATGCTSADAVARAGPAVVADLADAVMDPACAAVVDGRAFGCRLRHAAGTARMAAPMARRAVVSAAVHRGTANRAAGRVPPDCARHRPGHRSHRTDGASHVGLRHRPALDRQRRRRITADRPYLRAAEAGTFMGWSSVISISTIAAVRGRCSTRCRWTGC